LFARTAAEIAPYGPSRVSSVNLGKPGTIIQVEAVSGIPSREWVEYYLANGFLHKDPVAKRAVSSLTPFTWGEVEQDFLHDLDACRVFDAARGFGLCAGLLVPVPSRDGSRVLINFTGDTLTDNSEDHAYLHLVATYSHLALERMGQSNILRPSVSYLTDRQVECLKWVRAGKTDWEIGQVLGLSEATVNRHIERAKARLGVRSRAQAVATILETEASL
jgi:DNA-binding CsgD family transcriptional regulator